MDKWLGLRLLTMGLLMGSSGAGADACAVLSWNASPGATALRLRGGRGAAPSSAGSVARAGAVGIRKRDRRKKLPSRQREKVSYISHRMLRLRFGCCVAAACAVRRLIAVVVRLLRESRVESRKKWEPRPAVCRVRTCMLMRKGLRAKKKTTRVKAAP